VDLADLVRASRRMTMPALIRQPLLHFILSGGLLFAFERAVLPAPDHAADPVISVDAAIRQRLRGEWQQALGRPPSAAEWQAQLARALDAELLLAEALRLELDASDPVVRERLLLNMRFAFPGRRASEDALLFEARALGMPRSDPVVRRRLLQVMERRLLAPAVPDADTLRAYVETHAQRYGRPSRHGFRQIWFADAQDRRIDLAGDAFLLGARQAPASVEQLAQRYGAAFAQAVAAAEERRWTGPLRSVYGVHFVFVDARSAAQPPDFSAVRAQAAVAWAVEQRSVRLHAALQALRARYGVELAQLDAAAPG
jgi:hypothetical protein